MMSVSLISGMEGIVSLGPRMVMMILPMSRLAKDKHAFVVVQVKKNTPSG